MKTIKYILVLIIGIFAFSACDSNDTDRTIYHPANTEAAFVTDESEFVFNTGDPNQISVNLMRGNSAGSASIALTVANNSGILNVPSTADFADGVNVISIPITVNTESLVVGEEYEITLSIPENPIRDRYITHTIILVRES